MSASTHSFVPAMWNAFDRVATRVPDLFVDLLEATLREIAWNMEQSR